MGTSWSMDPLGFQHTLNECLILWLVVVEWGGYSRGHSKVWHADICPQYGVWMDNHISFQGLVGNRTWSIFAFRYPITRNIAFPLIVIVDVWWRCWQYQLLLCCWCVLGWVVVDGQVWQGLVKKRWHLAHSEKCTQFCFCCRCSNKFEDGALDMDGPLSLLGLPTHGKLPRKK